jgi:S-DNA-T family DNA segregation ATPase FtsK/SpoIIIE
MWKRCPDNKPPLTVPVGFGDNSSAHFIDPAEYPHLLITGGTGWGKSNMVNQIICFWLWRGITPADLKLVLFDLKKGMEFASYENLPHLYKDDVIKTGIIEDLEGVMPTLHRMQDIRDERMEKIKRAGYKNFQEFNKGSKEKDRLPAIFLVFDEWAKIRLSRTGLGPRALVGTMAKLSKDTVLSILRKGAGADSEKLLEMQTEFGNQILKLRQSRHFGLEAEEMLAEFTNLARAAGMYVILSTQHPSREVLTGLIMINFPTRIVLNSSVGGSMAALGTQSAFKLEYKGRAILLDRGEEIKVQTPMISMADTNAIVRRAITGEPMSKIRKMGMDIEEVLLYSLHNLDGWLDIQKIYEIYRKNGVRKDWLRNELRALQGKETTLSGVTYKISPPGSHTARRLIRL